MTLIDHLIDQLGLTRQQAEGAAGLLLQQAQNRLSRDEFLTVVSAIPAISDLIGKAPRQLGPAAGPLRAMWQTWFSGWGELASLRPMFERLGFDRGATDKLIAATGSYIREQRGVEVEDLLVAVWR